MSDWEAIVRAHGPMAFDAAWSVLGNPQDAEDVVQEALLDAFRLHSTTPVANWGGLLRRLAVCRAIDRLRSRQLTRPLAFELVSTQSPEPDTAAIQRELSQWLRQAIGRLPAREAEIVSLRYLTQMTNTEIAGELRISTDAVGVALHKARTKLKRLLSAETSDRRSTK